MVSQEQISQIDSQIAILESNKRAAENLGFTDNATILQKQIDDLQNQKSLIQNELSLKNSANGQSAQDKVNNDLPSNTPGAGQQNNDSKPKPESNQQPLSESEAAKLNENKSGATEQKLNNITNSQDSQDKSRANTIPQSGSESSFDEIPPQYRIKVAGGRTVDETPQAQQNIPASLLQNSLHQFTSYTYKLSLYLLTVEDYRNLNKDPTNFLPRYLLISSGGGLPSYANSDQTGWHPDFQEDFYFDNFVMETVVGLNSRTKASNAIDIRFSIIEPYGMTLLDRLFSACQTTANSTNYVDQPYMLQIDFLCNPDEIGKDGLKGNVITSKKLAIKFIEFKIKPGVNGTTYHVRAIPYNHTAFNESAAAVPVNLSVEAKTVGDYFDSRAELAQLFDQEAANQEERIESAIKKINDPMLTAEELEVLRAKYKAQFVYTTKSFPAGYNTYFKNIAYKEGRFEQPLYQIAFNIHPSIANSNIIDSDKVNSSSTTMTSTLENYRNTTALSGSADFKNKSVFNIMAGTDIVTLIDRVVAASEYIKNQVRNFNNDREQELQQDTNNLNSNARANNNVNDKKYNATKPTDWYKIIPSVTIGAFDKISRAYSKLITYSIIPYQAANFYHPDFKFTKVSSKQVVRTYNYFYTGLNQDIISMDIDFDATFVTGITTYQKSIERSNTWSGSDIPNVSESEPNDQRPASILPFRTVATPADTQYSGTTNRRTAEDYAVASVSRSLYSNYLRGDMLNVKLKIVGDPAFIKQDDVLYQPPQSSYPSTITVANTENAPPVNINTGQIIFDNEQVFVQLIVKGAVDIDDTIGITNKTIKLRNDQTTNGSFSGLYSVRKVTSELNRGKFEQILELTRIPDDAVELDKDPNGVEIYAVPKPDVETRSLNIPAGTITSPTPPEVGPINRTLPLILNLPATNPVKDNPGDGRPTRNDQPATAASLNTNNADNVAQLQEKPQPVTTAENTNNTIADFNQQLTAVSNSRSATVAQFSTELDAINNDRNLSVTEKQQKELVLRQNYVNSARELVDKISTLSNETDKLTPVTDSVTQFNKRINSAYDVFYRDVVTMNARIKALKQSLGQ